jgi:hypothetical protein
MTLDRGSPRRSQKELLIIEERTEMHGIIRSSSILFAILGILLVVSRWLLISDQEIFTRSHRASHARGCWLLHQQAGAEDDRDEIGRTAD